MDIFYSNGSLVHLHARAAHRKTKVPRSARDEKHRRDYLSRSVGNRAGWIGKRDELAHGIFLLGQGNFGLGIHNGEDVAAADAAQQQAVAMDLHNSILLVEDELLAHIALDAARPPRDVNRTVKFRVSDSPQRAKNFD